MKLSTCSSTCINWIPGILKSFRALHPGITVEVVSGFCNSQLTAKLRADEMLCVTSADFELRNHWYVVSDDLQGLPNMISYGDYGEEALPRRAAHGHHRRFLVHVRGRHQPCRPFRERAGL